MRHADVVQLSLSRKHSHDSGMSHAPDADLLCMDVCQSADNDVIHNVELAG